MKRHAGPAAALLAVLLAAAGCDNGTAPAGPGIHGRVVLHATATDGKNQELFELILINVNGQRVELVKDGSVAAVTATLDGNYKFPGLLNGTYTVRLAIEDLVLVQEEIEFSGTETEVPVLRAGSNAGVDTYPNPFPRPEGLAVEAEPTVDGPVMLDCYNTAMQSVYHFQFPSAYPAGFLHIHWTPEATRAPGLYWVRLRYDGTDHVDLVSMEAGG